MNTTYAAFALTAEQAEVMGADPNGIIIQGYEIEEYTTVYNGQNMFLDTDDIADTDDMDAALEAHGWERMGEWIESAGQMIAKVAAMSSLPTILPAWHATEGGRE